MVIPQYFFVSVKLGCSRCARNAPCWREPLQLQKSAAARDRWGLLKLTVARSPRKRLCAALILSLPLRMSVYSRFTGKSTSRTSKKVNERGEKKSVRSILLWQQRHLLRTHDHSPFPTVPAKTPQLPLLQYNCGDFVWFNTTIRYCVK